MPDVTLILFHTPARATDPPLTRLLGEARGALAERHAALFGRAGVDRTVIAAGRVVPPDPRLTGVPDVESARLSGARHPAGTGPIRDTTRNAGAPPPPGALPPPRLAPGRSFGEALANLIRDEGIEACIVMGDGAVPRLRATDAARLVRHARGGGRTALTNNRYSSDVCAVADASVLRELAPLPSDNALPRWLEEIAGFDVRELPSRERLGLDVDGPLDLALLALAPDGPASLRALAAGAGVGVPRLEELRAVGGDPRRELLVFGRSSSRALAWLEGHVRCRVRFLAEERGMRASSPLAIRDDAIGAGDAARVPPVPRHPRATIGRLLDRDGPGALGAVVAGLADAAILDSRVLLADRLGAEEAAWPSAEDRFASDLLRADRVDDPWLRELTAAAASARAPILLGGHTLVGPGVPLLFAVRGRRDALR